MAIVTSVGLFALLYIKRNLLDGRIGHLYELKQVFVLQFPVGEFDMVVFDPVEDSCKIYEIKHSEEAISNQYRHLIDKEKCAQTEYRYGPIMEKTVLYRGKNQIIEEVRYQNVEEYLRNIV